MWCWWAAMGHLLSLRKGKEWVFGQAVLNQARKPSPRRADCLRRLPLPLRRSIHPNSNSTHHHTITATTTTTMPEADLRRRMQDQRAAIDRRIAEARQRATAAAAAFSAAILSARSIANQTVSNRAQLNELKQQLRKLEADLAQTLSVQTIKRSKHKLMGDSILNTTATNEHLRSLLMDQKAKRDEYANAISNQLQAIESLEAESDAKGDKNLEKAIMWYNMLLGFQVVGGEGVKFVFSKIDVQNPDKEYSFCIKLIEQRYILIQCVPFVDGSKELVKDLNCNNDLYKFVRIMRERFQAATANGNLLASSFCPDMPSIITSSLSALSLDSRSENSTNQSYTESRPKNQEIPTKKGSTSRSATSSPSTRLCSMRHSPQIIERC